MGRLDCRHLVGNQEIRRQQGHRGRGQLEAVLWIRIQWIRIFKPIGSAILSQLDPRFFYQQISADNEV